MNNRNDSENRLSDQKLKKKEKTPRFEIEIRQIVENIANLTQIYLLENQLIANKMEEKQKIINNTPCKSEIKMYICNPIFA